MSKFCLLFFASASTWPPSYTILLLKQLLVPLHPTATAAAWSTVQDKLFL